MVDSVHDEETHQVLAGFIVCLLLLYTLASARMLVSEHLVCTFSSSRRS